MKASGVRLDADLMARVEDVLESVTVTDPKRVHDDVPVQRP